MKVLIFLIVAAIVVAVVTGKKRIEKFETESDPEYIKAEWRLKEVDGEQLVDTDFYILKNIANIMYTTVFNKKVDGEFKELFRHGPIDPCSDEFKNDEKHKLREEHMKKYGNMTFDHICPFNEGYYYLRDMKCELPNKAEKKLENGEYMMEITAKFSDEGVDRQVLSEKFFVTIDD